MDGGDDGNATCVGPGGMEKLAGTSWAEEQAPRRWTVWMGRGSHKATSTARAAAHLRGTTEHQTEEGFTDTNHNAVVGNAVADDVLHALPTTATPPACRTSSLVLDGVAQGVEGATKTA